MWVLRTLQVHIIYVVVFYEYVCVLCERICKDACVEVNPLSPSLETGSLTGAWNLSNKLDQTEKRPQGSVHFHLLRA